MHHLRTLLLSLLLALVGPIAAAETINLNTADRQQLMQMEGVGEAKAQAIVEYRKENGPFRSVEQLIEVNGIGSATLETNRGRLEAGGNH